MWSFDLHWPGILCDLSGILYISLRCMPALIAKDLMAVHVSAYKAHLLLAWSLSLMVGKKEPHVHMYYPSPGCMVISTQTIFHLVSFVGVITNIFVVQRACCSLRRTLASREVGVFLESSCKK